MTAAALTPARAAPHPVAVYRDDGPLALALGRALGTRVPLAGVALAALALAPVAALAALGGDDPSPGAVAACVGASVVAGALAGGRPLGGRLAWAVPGLVRALEYGTLLWLAAVAGGDALPACYALLAALAFRHYDAVYRLRFQRVAPAAWLRLLGGWDGRLAAACALYAAGALSAGLAALAAVVLAAAVTDSIASWVRHARTEQTADYGDQEDDE